MEEEAMNQKRGHALTQRLGHLELEQRLWKVLGGATVDLLVLMLPAYTLAVDWIEQCRG